MEKQTLVGAHTSIAGGVYNALYEGQNINASTIQLFTSNQKQWQGKPITDEDAKKFIDAKKETNILTTVSHNNYLTNLGSAKPNVLEFSKTSFQEEIQPC